MRGKRSCSSLSKYLVLFCVLFLQIAPFAAANNQGFVWGLEPDTRLDYREIRTEESRSETRTLIDEEMYIITDELPDIPDDISSVGLFIPYNIQGSAYWKNGSEYPYVIGSFSNFQVLPIGNWPLLTSIFEENREIFQDSEMWGMRYSDSRENISGESDYQFLKEDGALAYAYCMLYNSTSDFRWSVEITREGYSKREPTLFTPIFWTAAILGIVGLPGVILVFWRRRIRSVQ